MTAAWRRASKSASLCRAPYVLFFAGSLMCYSLCYSLPAPLCVILCRLSNVLSFCSPPYVLFFCSPLCMSLLGPAYSFCLLACHSSQSPLHTTLRRPLTCQSARHPSRWPPLRCTHSAATAGPSDLQHLRACRRAILQQRCWPCLHAQIELEIAIKVGRQELGGCGW